MLRINSDYSPQELAEQLTIDMRYVGETNFDRNALNKLKEVGELTSWLLYKILILYVNTEDKTEQSAKELKNEIKKQLKELITNNDLLDEVLERILK